MKKKQHGFLQLFLLVCIISAWLLPAVPPAFAQAILYPKEMATSMLMSETRDLMERGRLEQAVPYLEELLERLEGFTDTRSMEVRAICMYQLGLCYLETERYADAAHLFQTFVAKYPESKSAETARLLTLEAFARTDDPATMQAYLDQLESSGELDRLFAVFQREDADVYRNAVLRLVTLYARTANLENLNRFLPFCDAAARSDIGLNLALIEGGDLARENGELLTALALYRMVMQNEALKAEYDRQIARLRTALGASPSWVPLKQREMQTAQQESEQARYQRLLEVRQELDSRSYDPDLFLRIAHCYEAMERFWPAWFLFERIVAEYPGTDQADAARYSAFQTLIALEEYPDAKAAGSAYAMQDPPGRFLDEVTLALMQLHVSLGELDDAEAIGRTQMARQPEHRFADQIAYLLGIIHFTRQDFEQALDMFSLCATRWPGRTYAEESEYWTGMCNLFTGRFEKAIAIFQRYLDDPERETKAFEEDVTYRLGMAQFGLGQFETAEDTFLRFTTRFPESPLLSEALSMIGDLRGAEGDLANAIEFYAKARESAIDITQENYAVFQSARVHELEKRYEAITELIEDYIAKRGSEADFARAGLWLTKSLTALGENARAIEVFSSTLTGYGHDPLLTSIDELIDLLLRDIHRQQDHATALSLREQLAGPMESACNTPGQATLCLRLATVFAETGRENRPLHVEHLLRQPSLDPFSPVPLLVYAREAATRNDADRVQQAFAHFANHFAATGWMPEMTSIQIQSLIETRQYDDALTLAEAGLRAFGDHPQAGPLKKLTGDIYRQRGLYDEAASHYNEFLSVRQWRGSLTPEVLYWLGVCRFEQGQAEEAFAFFQRIYVLYSAYPEWMAKAYERSAECLIKLGRTGDAVQTWREMVAHPVVSQMPEGIRARAQLDQQPRETP